jgi:type II secretory pathway component PulC
LKHFSLREAGVFSLEMALVAALAISLAHWTWAAATPRALAASALAEQQAAQPTGPVARRHLFGAAQEGAQPVADAGGGLALLGVFSERRPDAGRAILARQGSRPMSVVAGESIGEGLVLHEVHPDHVIILRAGVPERIELERRTVQAAPQPPVARTPVRQ